MRKADPGVGGRSEGLITGTVRGYSRYASWYLTYVRSTSGASEGRTTRVWPPGVTLRSLLSATTTGVIGVGMPTV